MSEVLRVDEKEGARSRQQCRCRVKSCRVEIVGSERADFRTRGLMNWKRGGSEGMRKLISRQGKRSARQGAAPHAHSHKLGPLAS